MFFISKQRMRSSEKRSPFLTVQANVSKNRQESPPLIILLWQEVAAWENELNSQRVKINWRFTTQDARIKLKRLYPILEKECL
jgi:hypothetical protein